MDSAGFPSRRSARSPRASPTTFDAYAAAGLDGIGIWELKLRRAATPRRWPWRERARRRERRARGSVDPAAAAAPRARRPGGARRLATPLARAPRPLRARGGRLPHRPRRPRRRAVDGRCARSRREAERLGLRLALEPFQREGGEQWSILHTLRRGRRADRRGGRLPALGIQFDVWHLWNTPTCSRRSRRDDRPHRRRPRRATAREPTRGWADRVLPGDGVGRRARHPRRARRTRAGTASTTSRSSPTTARSAPRTRLALGCRGRRSRAQRATAVVRTVLVEPDGHGDSRGSEMKRWSNAVAVVVSSSSRRSCSRRRRPRRTDRTAAGKPIVIGWAFDQQGPMAPFDAPALAAAQIEIKPRSTRGRRRRQKLVIKTCNTQGDEPAIDEGVRAEAHQRRTRTSSSRRATSTSLRPSCRSHQPRLLTVAPCIGTDQMGPKRFGPKGKLAFSFGNVAQDEGSAMAQFA